MITRYQWRPSSLLQLQQVVTSSIAIQVYCTYRCIITVSSSYTGVLYVQVYYYRLQQLYRCTVRTGVLLPSPAVVDGRPGTRCGPWVCRQRPQRSLVGEFHSQTDSTSTARTYTASATQTNITMSHSIRDYSQMIWGWYNDWHPLTSNCSLTRPA